MKEKAKNNPTKYTFKYLFKIQVSTEDNEVA